METCTNFALCTGFMLDLTDELTAKLLKETIFTYPHNYTCRANVELTCLTSTLWKQMILQKSTTTLNPTRLPSSRKVVAIFRYFHRLKRCQVESSTKTESLECLVSNDAVDCNKKEPPKTFKFNINGTSKFPGANKVVNDQGKEVLLRNTLAYGNRHGIGVFFLTGEEQIAWLGSRKGTINV